LARPESFVERPGRNGVLLVTHQLTHFSGFFTSFCRWGGLKPRHSSLTPFAPFANLGSEWCSGSRRLAGVLEQLTHKDW
jgi:hypothetical protein